MLFQTTSSVLERQISSIVSSSPLAKPHLETRDTMFLGRQVHQLVLSVRRSVRSLRRRRAVGDSRWRAENSVGPQPYDPVHRTIGDVAPGSRRSPERRVWMPGQAHVRYCRIAGERNDQLDVRLGMATWSRFVDGLLSCAWATIPLPNE